MTKLNSMKTLVAALGLVALAACTPEGQSIPTPPGTVGDTDPETLPTAEVPASSSDAPFMHPAEPERDPFVVFEEMIKEGPRDYTSRVHGCTKVPYAAIGAYLRSRGVNTGNTTAGSAGALYRAAQSSIGVANLPQRVRDGKEWTTSATTDLLDIMVAAVNEVNTNIPNANACKKGGVSVQLFTTDTAGATTITADGATCLMGIPATPEHLALAATFIKQATSDADGRILAVAALMASAQMCQ